MSTVPKKIPPKIAWFLEREDAWTSNAAAIGISTGEMTIMSAKIATAADALAAQMAAKSAAKDATVALYEATRYMGAYGAELIAKIRAKAGQVGGDSVYVLASVPPPATPTPVGPPGTPFEFKVVLKPDGSLELSWKCNNPVGSVGTIYQVYRRDIVGGEAKYLGGTGIKKFVDTTVPGGAAQLGYVIQATRSTAVGDAIEYVVKFGASSAGLTTLSVAQGVPAKLSA